jgi:hypothetical protein
MEIPGGATGQLNLASISRGIAVRRHAAYNGVMKRESDSPASTHVARIIIAAVATLAAITLPCFQPSFAAPMRCSGEETSCITGCKKSTDRASVPACITNCGLRQSICKKTGCWDSGNQKYCGLLKQ